MATQQSCIAYNSSVEDVLNKHDDLLGKLHVGTGCAFGKALIGMLGTAGDRDPVCIGNATITAESVQLSMQGNHLGITKDVYEAITDEEIKEVYWLGVLVRSSGQRHRDGQQRAQSGGHAACFVAILMKLAHGTVTRNPR